MVELLAVLGIVTILAVLAVPLWQQSRTAADRATASSQMRQIGVALMQCVADRDGTLPGPMKSGQGAKFEPGKTDSLATVLGPYLGVTDLTKPAVPTSVWAFCDADQLNPQVVGQPWAGGTPKEIVHGRERLGLYFDGSVGSVGEGVLVKPPPPPPR